MIRPLVTTLLGIALGTILSVLILVPKADPILVLSVITITLSIILILPEESK